MLRADRGRLRVRARLGATADLGDGFRVEARLRTGVSGSQQGANVTFADFTGNPTETLQVLAERDALRWKRGGVTIEGGRMAFPSSRPTSSSGTRTCRRSTGGHPLAGGHGIGEGALTGGGFKLPSGLTPYSGALYAGQAVVEAGRLTGAVGPFRFAADRTDPDRLVQLDGNGSGDYSVLALNGPYKRSVGGRPLSLTADLYRNLQGYASASDMIGRASAGARTGFVLGVAWGDVAAALAGRRPLRPPGAAVARR